MSRSKGKYKKKPHTVNLIEDFADKAKGTCDNFSELLDRLIVKYLKENAIFVESNETLELRRELGLLNTERDEAGEFIKTWNSTRKQALLNRSNFIISEIARIEKQVKKK